MYNRNAAHFGKERAARQRAVAADYDETFNAVLLKIVETFTTTFFRLELLATSRTEKSAAALNQIADRASLKFDYIIGEHTFVAVVYAENLNALIKRSPDNRASRRVHAGAVAARCHYRYRI